MSLSNDYVDFGPPFDDSDADIILRSDSTSALAPELTENRVVATDFFVHKIFLVKASSVFKILLSSSPKTLDQENAEALEHGIKRDIRGSLPVLCLSEDCDTVHRLLTAIYPTNIVHPQTCETMMRTLAAAKKYGMPSVLAMFRYCSRVAPVVTAKNAFRAYVLASNEGLKEEALEAAELTLLLPQTFETYGSSICNASGPALRAFWKHRGMAKQAIKRGVDLCLEEVGDLRDWKLRSSGDKDCCNCKVPAPGFRERFVIFTKKIPRNFSTLNISNFVDTMSSLGGSKCTSCKRLQRLDNLGLFDSLERHVRGQIEQMHDTLLSLFDGLGETIDPQPSSGQPRNFGAPFDRGDSDVTIRSYDRVDFQVHKAILGIASAAFEDMFTAPGPSPHGQEQVKQVIDLTEDSKTLLHLLSVIYPMDTILPDTLEDALSLLSAFQKYQMESTATQTRASIWAYRPPLFTAENSFRAYGTASRYHLEEEALLSARLTLERPMSFEACGEDLRFISGADLFRLHGYRNECTKIAERCINKMTISSSEESDCPDSVHTNGESMPRCLRNHFLRMVAQRPSPKAVTDWQRFKDALIHHLSQDKCSPCSRLDQWFCNTICASLKAKLSTLIEQVRLGVPI